LGDVVTDWNATLEAAHRNLTPSPGVQMRNNAIVHAAIFDAVNGIAKKYTPLCVTQAAPTGASAPSAGGELELAGTATLAGLSRETARQEWTETNEERLLDVYYAELADPALGTLLKQRPELVKSVQEVVIGADDRVRVTATTTFPWRAVCSLRITAKDNSQWIGTGWFVGPRTLITAGHVVFIHSRGGWARSIEVIPGRNAASKPYGSALATSFRSVTGWTQSKDTSYDYGAIVLPSGSPLGNQTGWFGFANLTSSSLQGLTVNLSGYPGDKPAGTQWWHARSISGVQSRRLVYNIDTAGGQSGSPVWRLQNGQRHAVGIHTNGASTGNSATRITSPVFDNIKKWKAEGL
jgi:V8-like Glu-specific endopeptidase